MKAVHIRNAINNNAGDWLIMNRIEEYWKSIGFEVEVLEPTKVQLGELEKYNAVIIGGGPQYCQRLFENDIWKLQSIIEQLGTPIFFEGAGIYSQSFLADEIFGDTFSPEFIRFFHMIEEKGGGYGYRDYLTESVMRGNGLKEGIMIGCPAWIDKQYLDVLDVNPSVEMNPKRIIISDPGMTKDEATQDIHAKQVIDLLKYLSDKFLNREIIYSFNGGINTKYSAKCNTIIKDYLDKENIKYFDGKNDAFFFNLYDTCDLHIGYRLHSHIYCMSKRIPSILIEEDARGYGFNDCVGLSHIQNYNVLKSSEYRKFVPNEYLIKQIDAYIDSLYLEEMNALKIAYEKMNYIYHNSRKRWENKIFDSVCNK